ncbi:hypothetical protein ACUIAC_01735 [Dermabacteraceae bacterium P13138]
MTSLNLFVTGALCATVTVLLVAVTYTARCVHLAAREAARAAAMLRHPSRRFDVIRDTSEGRRAK